MHKTWTLDEVDFLKVNSDPVGRVFRHNGRFFRAITPQAEAEVRALLSSDFFVSLMRDGLVVSTSVAEDVKLQGYSLILEHECIEPLTLPYEWTFHMLRDAGELILNLAERCQDAGYRLKDAHLWNVSFRFTQPIFLDFGSIVRADGDSDETIFMTEFHNTVLYPLQLWSKGNFYLANRVLADDFPFRRLQPFAFPSENSTNWLGRLCRRVARSRTWTIPRLRAALHQLPPPRSVTMWMDYHAQSRDSEIRQKRFTLICSLLKKYQVHSVMDIAANQGDFISFLRKNLSLSYLITSDYDSQALDSFYLHVRQEQQPFSLVLQNAMFPVYSIFSGENRFQADAVLAMALTHHLTLSQGLDLDYIFSRIAGFSSKYVLIEFMPKGLWNGETAPRIPEWYNREWFTAAFVRHFELLEEFDAAPNRVVFWGIKRPSQIG